MPFVKTLPGMPPTPKLVDYAEKYKDIFTFERSNSGVLLVSGTKTAIRTMDAGDAPGDPGDVEGSGAGC